MTVPPAAPAAVLALVAAAVPPRSLTCLMAVSAAIVAALRSSPSTAAGLGVWALVAALALGLAASALEAAIENAALDPPRHAGWTAAAAGAVCVATLIAADDGHILRWRFGVGTPGARLELPGAALVLGLALLATLAGSLATAAHLAARAPEGFRAGRIGRSLMVLGAGLAALGVAVTAAQGFDRGAPALSASARELAAMVLAVGLLTWALARLITAAGTAEGAGAGAAPGRPRILRLAAAAAMLAAATAGAEGWRAEGTYATATLAATLAAALLGLVAVQPARLAAARIALFVLGLLAALARAV